MTFRGYGTVAIQRQGDRMIETSVSGTGNLTLTKVELPAFHPVVIDGVLIYTPECLHQQRPSRASRGMKFRFTDRRGKR